MNAETRMGTLVFIENKEQKPNENTNYWRVWVQNKEGKNERPLIFTEKEIERAERRGLKNKEDHGKRGKLQDLLD